MKRIENISPFIVMDILQEARKFSDTVHMEVGEPDIGPSPKVLESMSRAVKEGKYHYTPATGINELRERVAEHYSNYYSVNISPGRVVITPGTSAGFLVAFGMLLDSGERLCISDPTYPCYRNFAYFLNIEPARAFVGPDSEYEINIEMLERLKNIKALVVSSPSNPVGKLYDENNFRDLIDYCGHKGIYFISDEIYHGLVYEKKEFTALKYSEDVIVINGFSKTFCMPGFRLGWMILPENLIRKAEIIIQNIFISSNTPSQYAACEAFDYDYMNNVRNTFKIRRDYLYPELSKLFDIYSSPDGAFYIWADISRYMSDCVNFSRMLFDERHVAVTPGIDFGENMTEKYIRFAYTKPRSELKEGISRIKEFIQVKF